MRGKLRALHPSCRSFPHKNLSWCEDVRVAFQILANLCKLASFRTCQAKLWELTPEQRIEVLAPGIYAGVLVAKLLETAKGLTHKIRSQEIQGQ